MAERPYAVALEEHFRDPELGAYPTRFGGFATIPTQDPAAVADEPERAVAKPGFKGAAIHGLTNGRFHDRPDFCPIYERAQELDVPVYFHPESPSAPAIAPKSPAATRRNC